MTSSTTGGRTIAAMGMVGTAWRAAALKSMRRWLRSLTSPTLLDSMSIPMAATSRSAMAVTWRRSSSGLVRGFGEGGRVPGDALDVAGVGPVDDRDEPIALGHVFGRVAPGRLDVE